MSSHDLQKNILTTLAYYDAMDYPLTAFEIWKYLTRISGSQEETSKCSLADVVKELDSQSITKVSAMENGFYFLRGRQQLVNQRLSRNKIAERKIRRLLKTVKLLRFVPYVRMIAVTGRLAMKNTESKSDLDLLIVLKHGKIFTGRILVTLVIHLLRRRRYGSKIADRICLNYYITNKSLEINLKDAYSASEYSFMYPVFGFELFQEFQKKNHWICEYKPNFQPDELANLKIINDSRLIRLIRSAGENLLSHRIIENYLKRWQIARIKKDPRTHKNGSLIVANDEMLIFLPEPQSPKIFDKFQQSLANLAKTEEIY